MQEFMDGTATPIQIGSLLTALRMKGETVDEIAAFATVMREHALKIHPKVSGRLVDTCGTGGDSMKTFNISTISALVVAGAGATVAKHGNRSFTSKCGSADLLEALGVNLNAPPDKVEYSIEQAGIGFMFAQIFHVATRNVSAPRKEIGIRTVFNILGPLTNPANAKVQVLGVYDDSLVLKMARVLDKLGVEDAIVVHGIEGFDEIALTGKTHAARLHGDISEENLTAHSFGLPPRKIEEIAAPEKLEDYALMAVAVLSDSKKNEAVRDTILANASAALVACGKASDYVEGVEVARESLDSGKALDKLEKLVRYSSGDYTKTESFLRVI